jgi:F-type H+-transporting ATPase subunit b
LKLLCGGFRRMPEVHVIPDITLFVQLGIFLVFMFIMKKVYFDPYLEAFDEREKTVEKLLEEAEINNKKANEILEEVEKILAQTREESKKIMESYHKETAEMVNNILRKAQEEAEKEIEDAKKEVAMTVEIEKKTMDKIIEKMAEEIAEKLLLKEKAA